MIKNSQKGVSLYFAVAITSLLLSIALGLAAISIGQIKTLKEMGDSVKAFFASETGMERILLLNKECHQANCATSAWSGICNASCTGFSVDYYSTSSQWDDTSYLATASSSGDSIIFKSKGIHKAMQRAIEVTQ